MNVRGPEMAPDTPNAPSAPAKPDALVDDPS